MLLYNTLSKKKEEFVPRNDNKVTIYVCGITGYDYSHIGHARSAVAFDILVRYLRYLGKEVYFIRNFTDIDDKIITRAQSEGKSCKEITEKYIDAYHEDMEQLFILLPNEEPKATECIPDMIHMIEELVKKGLAYATSSGSVYYRVRLFKEYGALSGQSLNNLRDAVRIEKQEEKEDSLDFVLWKSAKEGEPYWESPWGRGRPGWHIECSAMSRKFMELPIDIHGGGRDLIFPHHENEKAQTEGLCNCQFARFWVHNGFVQTAEEKMSKSLGNFRTVRELYKEFIPEVLRYFLLTKQYRNPIEFSVEMLLESEKNVRSVYQTKALAVSYSEGKLSQVGFNMEEEYSRARTQFFLSMEDDLNSAAALGYLFSMIHFINRVLEDKKEKNKADISISFLKDLEVISLILGLFSEEAEKALRKIKTCAIKRYGIDEEEIIDLIKKRNLVRQNKDYITADEVRQILLEKNIVIKDLANGTVWDIIV
ncbi:MAG: cysteine--tRNA ligase [Desulfovibrionaceae bacterium]